MAGSSGGASCRPRIHMKSRVFSELMEIQEDRSDRNGPSKVEARMQYLGTSRGQKRRAHSPVPHEPTEIPHPKRSCSVLDRLGQGRSRVARVQRPSSRNPSPESPSPQAWDPVGQELPPLLSATLRSRLGGPARVRGVGTAASGPGTAASGHAGGPAPGGHAVAAAPSGPQASRLTAAATAAVLGGLRPAVSQGKLRGSGRGTDLRQQLSARAAAAADMGSSRKARQGAAAAVKMAWEESDNEDESSLEAAGPGASMEHRLHSCGGVELQVGQQASGEEVSPTRCHSLGPGELSERLRHRLGTQRAEALRHLQAAGRNSSPRRRAAGRDISGRESSLRRQTARRDLSPHARDPSPRLRAGRSLVCGDQDGQKRHQEVTGTNLGLRSRVHCSPSLDGEDSPGQLAASGHSLERRGGRGVLQRLGGRGAAAQGNTVRAGGWQAADRQHGWHPAEQERLHRVRDRHAAKGPGRRHAAEEDSMYRAKHRHAADGAWQARDEQGHPPIHRSPPAAAAGKAAGAEDPGLPAESSLVEALCQPPAAKPAELSGTASAVMSGLSSTVLSERVASADVELPEVTSHFMSRAATARQQTVGSGRGRPNSSVVSAATLHPGTSAARQFHGNNGCSYDLGGLVQGMYADRVPGPRSLAHRLGLPVRI